jgi:predicted nucleic acid-binding protein
VRAIARMLPQCVRHLSSSRYLSPRVCARSATTTPTVVPVFADTNILIYALAPRDCAKQDAAQTWLTRCWQVRSGHVSTQVLYEFYVNLLRLKGDVFKAGARAEIRHLMTWNPFAIDAARLETDCGRADETSISRWDALIVAAAMHQNCETLLSEDLQHGKVIKGVQVVNPLLNTL